MNLGETSSILTEDTENKNIRNHITNMKFCQEISSFLVFTQNLDRILEELFESSTRMSN